MHSFHFDDQYNTFHSYSYAVAPEGQGVVGDEEAFAEKKGTVAFLILHAYIMLWHCCFSSISCRCSKAGQKYHQAVSACR